jgi:transketolase N-terminal domain/subunit
VSDPLDLQCIDTLRFLALDMVQKADSGHPGLPLGAAPMAYTLWMHFLKHHPANPAWADRDRFVLSAGHGSALLYALLHMSGYELSLDDIRRFRQWGSRTPGHPERGHTPGVEITTGPLGQGFANAVGMAIAEAQLAARYNRDGYRVVDHCTYALVSDGDLMEGISAEAASLAGHLRLGKLVCLYDDNRVTLAAGTPMAFTEDRAARFRAQGWHTIDVPDGNDVDAIHAAIAVARANTAQPSMILVRTHIGYGSPEQDSFKAHGSPLGAEGVRETKRKLGWPLEPDFLVPAAARDRMREALGRGARGAGMERAHASVRAGVSAAGRGTAAAPARHPAGCMGCRYPAVPDRCEGHGDTRRRRQGHECARTEAAGAVRRLGRSRSVDEDRAEGARRFQSAAGMRTGRAGIGRWRLEPCRPQPAFRRARTRDGRDRQRHCCARRFHSVRRDLPDLLRLHAAVDPPRRVDGPARDPCIHP